jgi:AcrR family transcriptional regulator
MAFGDPIGDRRSRRHAETRDEILATAWELVRMEGLAGLSLGELARRVGMRPPSLYTYFPSKHAIFDAMFAQGASQHLELTRTVELPDDPRAAMRAGMAAFFSFCTADPARYQLLFQRLIPGFEPSAESYAISVAAFGEMAAQLAARGIEGERNLDLLTALVTGLIDQQLSNDPGGDRWARLLDDAVDMYLAHVLDNRHARAATGRRRGRTGGATTTRTTRSRKGRS